MRTAIHHTESTGPRSAASFGRIARVVAAPWHGMRGVSANDADIRVPLSAGELDAHRLIAAARVARDRVIGDAFVALFRAVRDRLAVSRGSVRGRRFDVR